MKFIFFISLYFIIHHFFIYPLILNIFVKKKDDQEKYINDFEYPTISFIIPVYNEEISIGRKIENTLNLDYPKDKLEIIVANDNSNDNTNNIVLNYSYNFPNVKLIEIKKRKGKVNAQNEAVKIANGEILVFSDANNFWEKDSLKYLINKLMNKNVKLVTGKLIYINEKESSISYSETLYWKIETIIREMESKFYSLTAISGAIYALRRSDYIFLDPVYSHDITLPMLFVRMGGKVKFCNFAKAIERSGSKTKDEWKRKVRMFTRIYYILFTKFKLFINPFIYPFRFYFSLISHRTIRYFLPFLHILLFISSILLYKEGFIYEFIFYVHILSFIFIIFGFIFRKKIKFFYFLNYYFMFILSMIVGFINALRGNVKPFWEPIESARR